MGVFIDDKLNFSEQIKKAIGKTKKRAYCMSRSFLSKNVYTCSMLYKGYIRSILEYGITAYCPYQKGQIDSFEKVQRWVTRQFPGIGKFAYEKRLDICNLTTIEERMDRGIAIETFKIIHKTIHYCVYLK